ncbi:MAG: glycoside hydrolase family 15 protein [Acetobacteraceae bacterium]
MDWLCWPRFDSGACFAALLGNRDNGRWLIAPLDAPGAVRRHYQGDTLVLETEFETPTGAASVVDFMPPRDDVSNVVRIVIGKHGHVRMRTELVVRFDYGSLVPWVTRRDQETLLAICGPDMTVLRTAVPLHGEQMKTIGEFTVNANEKIPFVLGYGRSHLDPPARIDPFTALEETLTFWRGWSRRFTSTGREAKTVHRSLITLKALTYRPTGGIVAAATTSLPELPGGGRNWDYRYCWLRDATFALLAMMNDGCYEEAKAWRSWLRRAVAGAPAQVQIMYGLGGERRLAEWEVSWLGGYEGSQPVRIGNAAAGQLQLDIYGEVMDALYYARQGGLAQNKVDWDLQRALLQHLETIWRDPDEGIWEVRGGRQHFTYSKVMAWVAFDRAIKSVEQFGLKGPVDRWRTLRREIHEQVCDKAFNTGLGAFAQSYGSSALDASVLLMPLVGFLPPGDQRVRATVEAIEQKLMPNGLVQRYDTGSGVDGLSGSEGAFLACSFWLADNLLLLGRRDDARRLFERLVGLSNDLGLLAEEYDPVSKRLLGNFPQALSHLALVNTAHNLYHHKRPAEQRSGHRIE